MRFPIACGVAVIIATYLVAPAYAADSYPFEKGCNITIREVDKTLATRPKWNVGSMWIPERHNQAPWDHGYLVALLRECRQYGFQEGPRWNEMVKLSETWVHPAGAQFISRDKVYANGEPSFGSLVNHPVMNAGDKPVCECISALGFYAARGSDLSGTLIFNPQKK